MLYYKMIIAQNKNSECHFSSLSSHQNVPRVVHSVQDTFKEHQLTERDPLQNNPDGKGPGSSRR